MSEPRVLVRREGDVAWLTLNRPELGNAFDQAMADALLTAAIACDDDASVRCVALTGAGRMFCAGGDIGLFQASGDGLPAALSRLAGTLHLAQSRLARMNKPLLVLVNGAAAGAGLGLALLGDVVIASRAASFASAYGAIGLSPDGGLSWLLPRLVGLRRAQEIILAGRRLDADEAAAMGLVTRTVDVDAFAEAGAKEAARLAALSAPAIGSARNLLLESLSSSLESHLEREARSISALSRGAEAKEGVTAFLEKRKADFKGKTHG